MGIDGGVEGKEVVNHLFYALNYPYGAERKFLPFLIYYKRQEFQAKNNRGGIQLKRNGLHKRNQLISLRKNLTLYPPESKPRAIK